MARRDTQSKESISRESAVDVIRRTLDDIQTSLFQRALDFRAEHTSKADSYDEFKEILDSRGGFIEAHWDEIGRASCRERGEILGGGRGVKKKQERKTRGKYIDE